jgi:hypothetical protein
LHDLAGAGGVGDVEIIRRFAAAEGLVGTVFPST